MQISYYKKITFVLEGYGSEKFPLLKDCMLTSTNGVMEYTRSQEEKYTI